MMNWLWAIPWILVLIFYAGWHFGGKVAARRELNRQVALQNEREEERSISREFEYLHKRTDELESKIEQIRFTKEDKNNG